MADGQDGLDLKRVGKTIARARVDAGLSQASLAKLSGLTQQQISAIENGSRWLDFGKMVGIAHALDLSLQRFLTGDDRPGSSLCDIAVELRRLGIVDIYVRDASIPGAFRSPEEVICLAASGRSPDPRVIEALPVTLAWNDLDPRALASHAEIRDVTRRVAWLSDVTLALDQVGKFPGRCHRAPLERFLDQVALPKQGEPPEDLGRPATSPSRSPIWRRWKISYDATLDQFRERAESIDRLRKSQDRRTSGRLVKPREVGEPTANSLRQIPGDASARSSPNLASTPLDRPDHTRHKRRKERSDES